MKRPICLLATAAVLAMFCGCQSMPMLDQPDDPLPPVVTNNGAPETLPDLGPSTIVENSVVPEGLVIPEPETPVVSGGAGMVYGGDGMVYGGNGYGDASCGQGCGQGRGQGSYPYHRHGLHARNMHHTFRGPQGPPTGQVTYPYYVLKGPRCFLMNDPPTIGP